MIPTEIKKNIRIEMLKKREAFQATEKKKADVIIRQKLESAIAACGAKVIHTYLPMGDEVDVYPLIEQLLAKKIKIICAKVLKKRMLENRELHSLTELEDGIYGTRHPVQASIYNGPIDFFIVPGLAFDKTGNRIGYGAGYYDTLLALVPNSAIKAGVCYTFQYIEHLPAEIHDIKMNQVITN